MYRSRPAISNSTDVDNPPDAWNAVGFPTASANGYGTYTLTAAGVWIYILDNSNPAVQALNVGGTLTDTFTATTVDGTPQVVTITILGTNDAAVISGDFTGTVLEAGGVANGTPGIPAATGDLDAADVDNPPDWVAVGTPAAGTNGFGTYTLTAAGVWTYTLDDNNAAVQALNVGDTLTDTFTATTVGGTTQVVTITIDGANDAAVISGAASGAVTEAGGVANGTPGMPTATGDLNSTDVDNHDRRLANSRHVVAGHSGFGTYTLTAAGLWTYTLDNNNPAVQALNVGQTLTDSFTVATIDGTTQLVTITINGTNDAAVITGDITGSVVEAGGVANGTPGTPTATGDLNSTDVDSPSDAWTAVGTPTASASGFGSYTLTAAGLWTYTLDNNNAAVQALNVGDTLTDTFTATTADGIAQLVTITINGANDAAVITGEVAGSVVEAGGVANGTPGTSFVVGNLDAADVDDTPDSWIPIETPTRSAGNYGTFTLDAAGQWVYILDDDNIAVQALNVGGTLTDTFTAVTVDGTQQLVTITITGANDAPVITGDCDRSRGRSRRCRQRYARHARRDRRPELGRCRQYSRCLDGGRHGNRKHQRLRQLYDDGGRSLDLHAGRQQCRGAGAQCRRHAERSLYRHHHRRHRPAGDRHHQRRQRRRRDQRRHHGERARGRRRCQRRAMASRSQPVI